MPFKRTRSWSTGYRKRARTVRRRYRKAPRRTLFRRSRPSMRRPRGFTRMQTRAKWTSTDFPQVLLKKFTWNDTFQVTPGNPVSINASNGIKLRLGSIYDPNYATGAGQHSANHYSTFMNSNLYANYQVMGCKVTLEFVNANIYMISNYVGLGSVDDINDLTDGMTQDQLDLAAMQPTVRAPVYTGPAAGGNNIKRVSFYVNPYKVLGLTRDQYMADTVHYAGGLGTNPLDGVYLMVQSICTLPNTGSIQTVNANLVFYTRLFNNSADPSTTEPVDPESLFGEMETLEKGSEVFPEKLEEIVGTDPDVPGSLK